MSFKQTWVTTFSQLCKIMVFLDVRPCGLVLKYWCFWGCCLRL